MSFLKSDPPVFTSTERDRLIAAGARNFLFAEWSYNNKRYRLKADPSVFVDLTRNLDEESVCLGTWKWVGPDGEEHGPHLTVEACLRDMDRRFKLPPQPNPRAHWRGIPRTNGGARLRLVP
jgi:hypothetical protein